MSEVKIWRTADTWSPLREDLNLDLLNFVLKETATFLWKLPPCLVVWYLAHSLVQSHEQQMQDVVWAVPTHFHIAFNMKATKLYDELAIPFSHWPHEVQSGTTQEPDVAWGHMCFRLTQHTQISSISFLLLLGWIHAQWKRLLVSNTLPEKW